MNYYAPRSLFRRYEILKRVKSGEAFLEVGAGKLGLAIDLLRYFDYGVVIELNPDVRQIHKNLKGIDQSRLDLIIGDFSNLSVGSCRYDCVVACEVMEHIEDDGVFLSKAVSALKPGGQLILSVPARMRYWGIDDTVVGHYRRYERESLRLLMRNCMLKKISISAYGFPFVNLLRVPRSILAQVESEKEMNLSQRRRSERSSQIAREGLWKLLGFFINRNTLYPFIRISSLLNPLATQLDCGDGYIATAQKSTDT